MWQTSIYMCCQLNTFLSYCTHCNSHWPCDAVLHGSCFLLSWRGGPAGFGSVFAVILPMVFGKVVVVLLSGVDLSLSALLVSVVRVCHILCILSQLEHICADRHFSCPKWQHMLPDCHHEFHGDIDDLFHWCAAVLKNRPPQSTELTMEQLVPANAGLTLMELMQGFGAHRVLGSHTFLLSQRLDSFLQQFKEIIACFEALIWCRALWVCSMVSNIWCHVGCWHSKKCQWSSAVTLHMRHTTLWCGFCLCRSALKGSQSQIHFCSHCWLAFWNYFAASCTELRLTASCALSLHLSLLHKCLWWSCVAVALHGISFTCCTTTSPQISKCAHAAGNKKLCHSVLFCHGSLVATTCALQLHSTMSSACWFHLLVPMSSNLDALWCSTWKGVAVPCSLLMLSLVCTVKVPVIANRQCGGLCLRGSCISVTHVVMPLLSQKHNPCVSLLGCSKEVLQQQQQCTNRHTADEKTKPSEHSMWAWSACPWCTPSSCPESVGWGSNDPVAGAVMSSIHWCSACNACSSVATLQCITQGIKSWLLSQSTRHWVMVPFVRWGLETLQEIEIFQRSRFVCSLLRLLGPAFNLIGCTSKLNWRPQRHRSDWAHTTSEAVLNWRIGPEGHLTMTTQLNNCRKAWQPAASMSCNVCSEMGMCWVGSTCKLKFVAISLDAGTGDSHWWQCCCNQWHWILNSSASCIVAESNHHCWLLVALISSAPKQVGAGDGVNKPLQDMSQVFHLHLLFWAFQWMLVSTVKEDCRFNGGTGTCILQLWGAVLLEGCVWTSLQSLNCTNPHPAWRSVFLAASRNWPGPLVDSTPSHQSVSAVLPECSFVFSSLLQEIATCRLSSVTHTGRECIWLKHSCSGLEQAVPFAAFLILPGCAQWGTCADISWQPSGSSLVNSSWSKSAFSAVHLTWRESATMFCLGPVCIPIFLMSSSKLGISMTNISPSFARQSATSVCGSRVMLFCQLVGPFPKQHAWVWFCSLAVEHRNSLLAVAQMKRSWSVFSAAHDTKRSQPASVGFETHPFSWSQVHNLGFPLQTLLHPLDECSTTSHWCRMQVWQLLDQLSFALVMDQLGVNLDEAASYCHLWLTERIMFQEDLSFLSHASSAGLSASCLMSPTGWGSTNGACQPFSCIHLLRQSMLQRTFQNWFCQVEIWCHPLWAT